MIITGKDIDVFDISDNKIATLGFAGGLYKRELMNEHYVQLKLNYTRYFEFARGSYINYQNKRYTIREESLPKEKSIFEYTYTLKFEAIEMFFQDFVLFYTMQDLHEVQWELTGTPQQFLQIALICINEYFGLTEESGKWKMGVCPTMTPILISFDSQNTFDGLTEIAEKFGAEWWLDYENKTLNLGYYEHGEEIELERDAALTDIKRSNNNSADYCTRLFAFGSTRNIPTNYRVTESGSLADAIVQKRLRLPVSNGDFIDAFPDMKPNEIIHGVKIFEHIFPQRTGEITELRVDDTQKDENGNPWLVFYFKDSALNFSNEYKIPGLELKATFGDNSWLSGRTFELKYHDSTQEFEIINNQDIPSFTIPNDVLKPRVGDNYVLFNFDISLVGDQYVGEAEQQLLEEATQWHQSVLEDNATYECPVNPVYAYNEGLDMEIGQKVKLISDMLKDGQKQSRIFGFQKNLEFYEDTYTIGDKPRYSRLRTINKTIESNKEISDLQHVEAMRVANGALRNVRALNYLREALENSTVVEGGLILTTLIRLGHMQGSVWKENAGINGINRGENDVAIWSGGTLDQAINAANDPTLIEDIAQFVVTHLGKLIANEVYLRGKFESNKNGYRIVIDPVDRSMKLIAEDNTEVASLKQYSNGSEDYGAVLDMQNNGNSRARFTPYDMQYRDIGSNKAFKFTLLAGVGGYPRGMFLGDSRDGNLSEGSNYPYFLVDPYTSNGKLKIILKDLPTDTFGLDNYQLWLNNGKPDIYIAEEG